MLRTTPKVKRFGRNIRDDLSNATLLFLETEEKLYRTRDEG